MTFGIGKIKVHISNFLFPVIPLMYICGFPIQYLVVFFSIFLHELGHIAAAFLKGGRLISIKVLPIGVNAEIDTMNCSAAGLIILHSAGPILNLVLSAAGRFIFFQNKSDISLIDTFCNVNLYLAVFNLIPVYPLDGCRLLQSVLYERIGIFLSARYIKCMTVISSVIFIFSGIYQLLYLKGNPSLLFIGVYMLIFLNTNRQEASLMNMKQLLYRSSKFKKIGVYPARELVVLESKRLIEVMKKLDFDRFHLIHILGADFSIKRTVTENAIMDALLEHGSDVTFEIFL